MRRKLLISLVLMLLASIVLTTPVFARDTNSHPLPDKVVLYTGGEATINLPTNPSLRTNYPPSATMMKITAAHIEVSTTGIDKCQLLIWLYMFDTPTSTTRTWEPYAFITTNPKDVAFEKNFWSGTYVEFPGPYYSPLFVYTDNVKLVSGCTLHVVRHGDSVYVDLTAPQQIENPRGLYFTVPAFCLQLDGYGTWIHSSETIVMTGWYGASGYTFKEHGMGFNANGEFTSSAWSYSCVAVSDGSVTIQGIAAYYPPTA